MDSLPLPADYPGIKIVTSFQELATTPFGAGINALCWPRTLQGDFAEVVSRLEEVEGVMNLEDSELRRLPVSPAGQMAVDLMLEDRRLLRELELDPVLNCIRSYPRDGSAAPVCTDVFSFHVDSAPVEADTWLCTYHGASSEGLRNDQAVRRVDLPETRAELLRQYGGNDDEAFREFLRENCYDLHYAPLANSQLFLFGLFNLWRIAVEYPGSPVPPCIHRAPATDSSDPFRLLLIS